MDCPYCGNTIEDGGFICASCSAPEQTEPIVSKENGSVKLPDSIPDSVIKPTEVISKEPSPKVIQKPTPKPITKKTEQLPTTIETKNSQIVTKKNQMEEEIRLPEPAKAPQQTQSSAKWKNYTIHPDLAPTTSILLITLFLLFVCSFLFVLMLIVIENGPRYAAVITGLAILILLVLPVVITLDAMRVKRWKRFATWVLNNGKRKRVTYEIKITQTAHGGLAELKILSLHGDKEEQINSNFPFKLPKKLAIGFGKTSPFFIPEAETKIVSEADIIYDSETIEHAMILEKDNHRLWLSNKKFIAPK